MPAPLRDKVDTVDELVDLWLHYTEDGRRFAENQAAIAEAQHEQMIADQRAAAEAELINMRNSAPEHSDARWFLTALTDPNAAAADRAAVQEQLALEAELNAERFRPQAFSTDEDDDNYLEEPSASDMWPQAPEQECEGILACFGEIVEDYVGDLEDDLGDLAEQAERIVEDPTDPTAYRDFMIEIADFADEHPVLAAIFEQVPAGGEFLSAASGVRAASEEPPDWMGVGIATLEVAAGPLGSLARRGVDLIPIAGRARRYATDALLRRSGRIGHALDGFPGELGTLSSRPPRFRGPVEEALGEAPVSMRARYPEDTDLPVDPNAMGQQGQRFMEEAFGLRAPSGPPLGRSEQLTERGLSQRIPDLFDTDTGRAIEIKNYSSGRPGVALESQVLRDRLLMMENPGRYFPEWHFVGQPPTRGLIESLERHGIPYFVYD